MRSSAERITRSRSPARRRGRPPSDRGARWPGSPPSRLARADRIGDRVGHPTRRPHRARRGRWIGETRRRRSGPWCRSSAAPRGPVRSPPAGPRRRPWWPWRSLDALEVVEVEDQQRQWGWGRGRAGRTAASASPVPPIIVRSKWRRLADPGQRVAVGELALANLGGDQPLLQPGHHPVWRRGSRPRGRW